MKWIKVAFKFFNIKLENPTYRIKGNNFCQMKYKLIAAMHFFETSYLKNLW
jgi:hypothetical protein